MNLKITSSTPISIGGSNISNIFGLVVQRAYDNEITGGLTVPAALKFWLSGADMELDKDQIYPLTAIGEKILSIQVELTAGEAAAAGLPYTIYLKVVEKLMIDNPEMTVTVEM